MKIGIIGINRYAKFLNFACDLHVYAFQQYLSEHGYDSQILDYKPAYFGKFDMREPALGAEAAYRRAVKAAPPTDPEELKAYEANLGKLAELAEGYRSAAQQREGRYDKFEAFVARHLSFTDEKYDSDLLEIEDPGFDCYICVTDVIWQAIPNHTFDRGFLLGSKAFEGKQKISYAASRGASGDFAPETAEQFFDYLSDIDAISVREEDFNDYIKENSSFDSATVLDPVMLHDSTFWSKVAVKPSLEKYLVLYYVMERAADTIDKAVEYAKAHDLTIVELSDRPNTQGRVTDPDVKHISRYDVGMEEWLGYIQHADAIFTNSFHGCCFSVIFEKPFFVGARNGNKVPNFLNIFGLGDRRFTRKTDVAALNSEVDYTAVREILNTRRAHSESFLLTALEKASHAVDSGNKKDTSHFESKRRSLTYSAVFNSGKPKITVDPQTSSRRGVTVKTTGSGAVEYRLPNSDIRNDGTFALPGTSFETSEGEFEGWTLRIRIDNHWFWLLKDGTLAAGSISGAELESEKGIIPDRGCVPHLSVNRIRSAVFTARWRPLVDQESQSAPNTVLRSRLRATNRPLKILLLTNRDSDNVGDQLIEACAISLIRGAMKNLGLDRSEFSIESRAAALVSQAYMRTGSESLLAPAREAISNADILIFGGAPLFNYSYQRFYLRTIKTIELAQEYGVPVLFSSIGIEPYNPQSPRSRDLKTALALPVVQQITTRDDLDSALRYAEGTDISVSHVSDPAVFADVVFCAASPESRPAAPTNPLTRKAALKFLVPMRVKKLARRLRPAAPKPATAPKAAAPAKPHQKRVGLVVTRAGIFKDNGIDFSPRDQRKFWVDTIKLLKDRGYDYHLFTTGHFADEAVLDQLVKSDGVPASKCTFVVNSPEELLAELAACDGVVAYRLHASIAAFAYGVPSIGLSWNSKVPYFYESVGHGDRALGPERWTADEVVPALEKAMAEGVHKDEAFLRSVYETLFDGFKSIVAPDSEAAAYSYDQLRTELPRYAGTSDAAYKEKVRRKLRRTYDAYRRAAY